MIFGIVARISLMLAAQYCTRKLIDEFIDEFVEFPDQQPTELITSRINRPNITARTTTTTTTATAAAANTTTTSTATDDDIPYFKRYFQFSILIIPLLIVFAFSLIFFFIWFIDMMTDLFSSQSNFLGLIASIE